MRQLVSSALSSDQERRCCFQSCEYRFKDNDDALKLRTSNPSNSIFYSLFITLAGKITLMSTWRPKNKRLVALIRFQISNFVFSLLTELTFIQSSYSTIKVRKKNSVFFALIHQSSSLTGPKVFAPLLLSNSGRG